MKRLLLFMLILATVCSLSSCRKMARKAREKIGIEAVERVEPHSLSSVDVRFRVKNLTGKNLLLKEAEFEISHSGRLLMTVTLAEEVKVPRRTIGSIDTQWRLQVSDPLAFYAVLRKVRRQDFGKITVNYHIRGRAGIFRVEKSDQMIPLSKILNIFGRSITEMKKPEL